MKKIVLIAVIALFLVGCGSSNSSYLDAYKGMTSAEIFHQGEMRLAKENYSNAVQSFEALDAIYPFGPYAQQGQLDIIYAYHMNDDPASALAAADRYIRLHPRGKHVDYAYYMKGLIGYQEGFTWLQRLVGVDPAPRDMTQKKVSFVAFSQLVILFPKSRYTPDALLHMAYIRNMIARQNLLIAEFYLKRNAYVAAANRASYIVQHFDRAPAIIPALAIMVESYRHLGLTEMANSSLHVLQMNFPVDGLSSKLSASTLNTRSTANFRLNHLARV